MKKVEKLEVGSGGVLNPDGGWTYHDIEKMPNVDIVCDMMDLDKEVEADSVKFLKCVHALEHNPTKDVPKVLEKFYKIMAKGGRVLIRVPNLQWHAQLLSEGRDEEAVLYCFGGQLDKYDFHKTGFTPKILKRLMEQAGFSALSVEANTEIMVTGYKE